MEKIGRKNVCEKRGANSMEGKKPRRRFFSGVAPRAGRISIRHICFSGVDTHNLVKKGGKDEALIVYPKLSTKPVGILDAF